MHHRTIQLIGCLSALLLGACDAPEASVDRDELAPASDPDGRVITEEDLTALCAATPEEASAHPDADALALCDVLDAIRGPGAEAVSPISSAPHPTRGECQEGEMTMKFVDQGCDSCKFNGNPGQRYDVYNRWCYKAPSPPACGCEPWFYVSNTCASKCQ